MTDARKEPRHAAPVVEPLPETQAWARGQRPVRLQIQVRSVDQARALDLMASRGVPFGAFARFIFQTGLEALMARADDVPADSSEGMRD